MYLRIHIGIINIVLVYSILFIKTSFALAGHPDLYFPPLDGKWETVSLEENEWKAAKLNIALKYAGEQNSSGVVILYRGRILAEQYWQLNSTEKEQSLYKYMLAKKTSDGRSIEDVASVQKSVISFLSAKAQDQGKLDLDRIVASYIGDGWSKASLKQESSITVRHLMSMTSGLDKMLNYMHPAGSVWEYNTGAYSVMVPVLTNVTKMNINQLTFKWLLSTTGMLESGWEHRKWVQGYHAANTVGFTSSARDLARFGLLVLSEGKWNGHAILNNSKYLLESLQPSQKLKPSYGLLWWLLMEHNAVAALGKLSRMVIIIPDHQIVVVRLGDKTKDKNRNFRRKFLNLIFAAMPD